ncbi:helicase domino isoform X3 [Prorops nasuta]
MSDKQNASILPPLSGSGGNNGDSNTNVPPQTVSLQQVLATAQGLNVLTTGAGQQFVITSQVPGLTQVIPSSATTNAGIQQVGVTRIVSISNTSPRVSVMGMAGASGSALTSPSRQTPTKVVLATSPKLVRTSIGNMFVTPTSQASMQSPPARKRLKLNESMEKSTASLDDAQGYKRRIMEHKMKRMRAIREKYAENASELFFLHTGGNMMEFQTWRKKPPAPQYLHFLRQNRLDPEDDDEDLTAPLPAVTEVPVSSTTTPISTVVPLHQGSEVKITGIGVTPVAVTTKLPATVAQLTQQGQVPGRPQGGRHGMVFAIQAAIQTLPVTVHSPPTTTLIIGNAEMSETVKTTTVSISATIAKTATTVASTKAPNPIVSQSQPVVKLIKLTSSTISSSNDSTTNQEQIVEKAKQEAYVMQRITELQREGLWSERRLPKVQEPARTKAHWDYLLEEMVWLAADFAQERKWKKAAAKKCARMVQRHFQEKAIQAQKAEKSQELRLKKIASFVAKEIKTFWTNVEKLVEYKQQTRLDEKRKKALDQHLNFIVGQTEKYSTWLTEGLNKTEGPQSVPASINSSRISSPILTGKSHSDEEFEPNQSSDDDEETIAKAEEEMKSTTNHKEEVELLKKESEIPLEDLLKDLPADYLEDRNRSLSPDTKEVVEEEKTTDGDTDFVAASDESSDEEDTIMEQEKLEKNEDHKKELDDLQAENEMSIDELMAKYGNMSDTPMEIDESDKESDKESEKDDEQGNEEPSSSSENESEESDDDETEDLKNNSENEGDVGLKSLLEDLSTEQLNESKTEDRSEAHNEMDDVAALAESIQPKGNTLLTTSVVTKIPFLLKHSLREYQHIGLDWLVTMYERKLNGILADEMGLGKTIQTIALLAHLACEKGNWGPHLIIVPTSVMLNWEMECKKWCPGFKILTYYGTQKERKQKRTGWTKPNAFHICITSYKLVIQDHQSFRRKKWKYLILDEAQNIKNFKSQRWQLLLNFQTQRRLLLTGTPLQNNLMELWSLMHFLMPNVFQSHREFKEWFSNPVTGMIEGNSEYNENIIRRLHKVLRPFLLRRLKAEVEKQLPKKYEHVVMCRLSKRQRYLYDDFMSRAKTKETLASGNLLSVINVLMQLRKVCNHPNLFEVRPTVSPFQMEAIEFFTASLVWSVLDYDPFKHIDLSSLNFLLSDLEFTHTAFMAHRTRKLQTPRKLIEEIDSLPDPPPRCPSGKIKINVTLSNQVKPSTPQFQAKLKNFTGILPTPKVGTSPTRRVGPSPLTLNNQNTPGHGVTLRVSSGQQLQGYSLQLVQHHGSVKAIPVGPLTQSTASTPTTTSNTQRIAVSNTNIRDGLQKLTQTVTVKQGDSVQRISVPSFAQLVQTSTGKHIILTSSQQNTNTVSFPVVTSGGQRLTVLSKSLMGLSSSCGGVNKVVGSVVTTTSGTSGRPVMRVPPLNLNNSQGQASASNGQQSQAKGVTTRQSQKEAERLQTKERPRSEFFLPRLEEERRQRRQQKLETIANINEKRCAACPLYGEDLFIALRIDKPSTSCRWHDGWIHCKKTKNLRTRKQFFSHTEALAEAIRSTEQIVEELKEVFERFVLYVPAVRAPSPKFHVSHPPPHKLWNLQHMQMQLQRDLSPKCSILHPVASAMLTQFPDPRLIQYDCGKLQSLDQLLRKLKSSSHRALIFTQMTRMLDVLEAFLNYHGYIYLRLDGTTRVDQRQLLMERFNGDKRIFCFILSTRSGGVGVNLTGADTVIFYDSDWNPTMDAQAQDRCHRIGQTRDVHIYRLISERTVEENILKKANQKRLLGDLAIEGGNFTTAYFKSSTIQDLFNIDQSENDASARMAEVLDRDREKAVKDAGQEEKVAMGALESALAAAEEELDVQAAKTAKAEAVADLAEFDENIPLEEADKEDVHVSKAEQEVQNLVSQLTPIERYAMKFVEESEGAFSAAQLAAAERELEQQKKEWEMDRLRALREEEERRLRLADDDEKPLTFAREDSQNQVNSVSYSKKIVNKKIPPGRRKSRRNYSKITQESSDSESETTTESETESQEDVVEDSLDEESSHTESQSQEDEDEAEETDDEIEKRRGYRRKKNRSNNSSSQNKLDLNSPRTRSRGNVKINLWTLDISPILPGIKPKYRGRGRKRKVDNSKTDQHLVSTNENPIDNSSESQTDLNETAESENADGEDKTDSMDADENNDTNESENSDVKKIEVDNKEFDNSDNNETESSECDETRSRTNNDDENSKSRVESEFDKPEINKIAEEVDTVKSKGGNSRLEDKVVSLTDQLLNSESPLVLGDVQDLELKLEIKSISKEKVARAPSPTLSSQKKNKISEVRRSASPLLVVRMTDAANTSVFDNGMKYDVTISTDSSGKKSNVTCSRPLHQEVEDKNEEKSVIQSYSSQKSCRDLESTGENLEEKIGKERVKSQEVDCSEDKKVSRVTTRAKASSENNLENSEKVEEKRVVKQADSQVVEINTAIGNKLLKLTRVDEFRVTRSTSASAAMTAETNNFQRLKRRPDTPLPDCMKASSRPVTRRSYSIVNSPLVKTEKILYEKPTTRSSGASMDNSFATPTLIRKNRNLPSVNSDSIKSVRKLDEETESNQNQKMEGENMRTTRSSLANCAKSNIIRKSRKEKIQEPLSSMSDKETSTDTNGNAVASEICLQNSESVEMNEKPQRTAKVVAILTLDTHSRNNFNKTSSSSIPTKHIGLNNEIKSTKKLDITKEKEDAVTSVDQDESEIDQETGKRKKKNKRGRVTSLSKVTSDGKSEQEEDDIPQKKLIRSRPSSPPGLDKINTSVS